MRPAVTLVCPEGWLGVSVRIHSIAQAEEQEGRQQRGQGFSEQVHSHPVHKGVYPFRVQVGGKHQNNT